MKLGYLPSILLVVLTIFVATFALSKIFPIPSREGVTVGGIAQTVGPCQGTAIPCGSFDETTCISQSGCTYNARLDICRGTATDCSSFLDQESCQKQSGCNWVGGEGTPVPVNVSVDQGNGTVKSYDNDTYLNQTKTWQIVYINFTDFGKFEAVPDSGWAFSMFCDDAPECLINTTSNPYVTNISTYVKNMTAYFVVGTTTTTTTLPGTTTTTTTLPSSPDIDCKDCFVHSSCTCNLNKTCEEGLWAAKNYDGEPLSSIVGQNIPPKDFTFTPNALGKIEIRLTCTKPEPIETSVSVISVKKEFLSCPSECHVDETCTCSVNGCSNGKLYVTQGTTTLLVKNVTSSSSKSDFTPLSTNDVKVEIVCSNPSKDQTATIKVTDIRPTTTTFPTITTTTTRRSTTTTEFVQEKPICPAECCSIDDPSYAYKGCESTLQECQDRKCVSIGQQNDITLSIIVVLVLVIIGAVAAYYFISKRTKPSGVSKFDWLYKKWGRK